ncbi:MAG: glycosyltransferase, partial [Muribaculaceae bacterium]|nr:glycosyltransferase [Muribaculaceae bacterium]
MTPGYINNVSVVVATRHDAEQVENRISAMLPSSGVELIVVYDEGRGVSYARNLGLEHADGKWVLFIDDDDHIDPSIFNTLNHRLSNTTDTIDRIGIIEWGYNIVDGNKIQTVKLADEPEIFSSANLVELMVDNKRFTSNLWNKLIRRELIGTLRFNESLSYGEDWDFLWRLISATTTLDMLIIPDILYDYQQHAQQVSAGFNKAKLTLPAAWTTMLHDIS